MLNKFLNFFTPPEYPDNPEKTQDARTTLRIGIALLMLAGLSIPLIFLLTSPTREFALIATSLGFFIWLFTIFLVKRGNLTSAKIIILTINTFNLYSITFATGGFKQSVVFTLFFLVAMSNLLFPRKGAVVYSSILLAMAVALYILTVSGTLPANTLPVTARSNFLIFFFTLTATAVILFISSTNYQKNIEEIKKNQVVLQERNLELDQLRMSLESRVSERTIQLENRAQQLQAISSIARSTASLQDIDILLPSVTKLVSGKFDFYHVGIFILDDLKKYAILRAANSEGGQRMLERNHSLKIDTNSIVGYSVLRNEARIALDVGTDAVYFSNPDLPETRSEIAIPLRVGSEIIGVLDVQSILPNAFHREDVAMLNTLADQVAIAIENTRLFAEAREALLATEETFAKFVQQQWKEYAQQAQFTSYKYDGKQTLPVEPDKEQKETFRLPQTGSLTMAKDTSKLSVPLKLRGQVIGSLDINPKNEKRRWTQDDLTLIEAAAERTALALENARLVESAQRRVARERAIGEITSRIGAVTDLDSIMRAAVEELGRKIGNAAEVILEIDSPGINSQGSKP